MNVLLTGGAGYVGSHVARALVESGHSPVILDDLSEGHGESVEGLPLIVGDVRNRALLEQTLRAFAVDAVVHLAGPIDARGSVQHPDEHYEHCVLGTKQLLEAMRTTGVVRLLMASSAAVYGSVSGGAVSESVLTLPESPYGMSKLTIEWMARSYAVAYGFQVTALRYFNVSGAHDSGEIGEAHRHEGHLIPLALKTALGQRKTLSVNGTTYDTPDGTCIRDYVHVCDLADAHLLALSLPNPPPFVAYNLGLGQGVSVFQILESCRRVSECAIPVKIGERMPGDPACIVSDSSLAQRDLLWTPKRTTLDHIITDAWRWHKGRPKGYESPVPVSFSA